MLYFANYLVACYWMAEQVNASCKGCRLSKTKCDLTTVFASRDSTVVTKVLSDEQPCSRCKRLSMHCIPEQRRSNSSSARARMGAESRALLRSEVPGLLPTVPSAVMPVTGVLWDDPNQGKEDPDMVVCQTFCKVIENGAPGMDHGVLEQLVQIVSEVALIRDHCGIMSYAMTMANNLGLRLSRILPSALLTPAAAVPPFEMPREVAALFESGCPCIMRAVSGGRTWCLPNPAFTHNIWVPDAACFQSLSPTKMLNLVEDPQERRRILGLIAQTLLAKPYPTGEGETLCAEKCGSSPIHCRMQAEGRPSCLIPHNVCLYYARSTTANFLCLSLSPATVELASGMVQGSHEAPSQSRSGKRPRHENPLSTMQPHPPPNDTPPSME